MRIEPDHARAVLRELSATRRAMGAASPEQFASIYLADCFAKSPSRMHRELFKDLSTLHRERGTHLAIAAPRGHAKSTVVTLAYTLWVLLYQLEPFVLVASGTSDQAQKLAAHVKGQLESNERLRQDFPELAGRPTPWREGAILLPTGGMLAGYSALQNPRGVRHQRHRPTLIIADDLEDKTRVIREEQRLKLAEWFNSTLLKAGDPQTNVVVVGTVLHQDSLLATLLDPSRSPTWSTRRYAAVVHESESPRLWRRWGEILRSRESWGDLTGREGAAEFYRLHRRRMDAGVEVLWPEVYPYDVLMATRLREGERAFSAEFQNDPIDPEQCLFARAPIRYWSDEYGSVEELLETFDSCGEFHAACDPSLGSDPTRGDFTAIIVLFAPAGRGVKYVIEADIARRSPDETIEQLIVYAKRYPGLRIAVEANNFQQLMVRALKERASSRRVELSVRNVQNRTNKQARILALESEVCQGGVLFDRRHETLMQQLRGFPLAKHDDGPDALEMAVTRVRRGRVTWIST